MDEKVQRAAERIRAAERVLAFTGAGLSTESGIPDFRSPGGIWDRYDPSDFEFDKIVRSKQARRKYWEMSTAFYGTMRDAEPNPAHLALKALEDMGKLTAIVTQNIDNLHQKAGSDPERVIEIHGTAFRVSCLGCGASFERDEIEDRLAAGDDVPACGACGGILKPATISFGQAMPEAALAASFSHARGCDLCLVLGSSLVVYPAAAVPMEAARSGAEILIINRDPTPLDSHAGLVLRGPVGVVLPDIVRRAAKVS